MKAESNKDLVQRLTDELWNRGKASAILRGPLNSGSPPSRWPDRGGGRARHR